MRKTVCIVVFFVFSAYWGYSQFINTLIIGDTTYSYTDAEFELLDAAAEGDTSRITAFLEIGTDVNSTTWDGVTPLMYAAQGGHLRVVEILIDAGANINQKPYNQIDALLGATIAGHVYVVDTLILNGAHVNTRDIDGVTPLMYAAAYDYELLTDVLLFYEAKVNASDNFGNEAIHYSTFYDNLNITDKLLKHGADIDGTDIEGFTPLMIAAQNGYYGHVAYLLDQGADIGATNQQNADALALAILNRHYPVIELLIERGVKIDRKITDKVDVVDLSWIKGDAVVRDILEKYGAGDDRTLRIDHFILDFMMNWNNRDFMLGGKIGLLESKHNIQLVFGYMTRPAVRSVRYETDPNVFYQYWERRSYMSLGADKFFQIKRTGFNSVVGAFGGLHGAYTYGNFRGSGKKPDDTFMLVPGVGLYVDAGILRLKAGYEFMHLKNSKAPPHRITMSLGITVNTVKNPVKPKKEPVF